jgi:hypothetical protein
MEVTKQRTAYYINLFSELQLKKQVQIPYVRRLFNKNNSEFIVFYQKYIASNLNHKVIGVHAISME